VATQGLPLLHGNSNNSRDHLQWEDQLLSSRPPNQPLCQSTLLPLLSPRLRKTRNINSSWSQTMENSGKRAGRKWRKLKQFHRLVNLVVHLALKVAAAQTETHILVTTMTMMTGSLPIYPQTACHQEDIS
jgi:hypothetical protein